MPLRKRLLLRKSTKEENEKDDHVKISEVPEQIRKETDIAEKSIRYGEEDESAGTGNQQRNKPAKSGKRK